jgi:hypothetical protein
MSTLPIDRGGNIEPTSLATRNLLRHLTWEITIGQQIAVQMGSDRLSASDLSIYGDFGANLDTATPLWLYLLREAEVVARGETLGPIGGRSWPRCSSAFSRWTHRRTSAPNRLDPHPVEPQRSAELWHGRHLDHRRGRSNVSGAVRLVDDIADTVQPWRFCSVF